MTAIEKVNITLKGVLPKDYGHPELKAVVLGDLIDLISGTALNEGKDRARDLLGRVYEYFLGQFAGSEAKRGGELYTPRSVVRTIGEMVEPYKAGSMTPAAGRARCSCSGKNSLRPMAVVWAISRSVGRKATTPPGGRSK